MLLRTQAEKAKAKHYRKLVSKRKAAAEEAMTAYLNGDGPAFEEAMRKWQILSVQTCVMPPPSRAEKRLSKSPLETPPGESLRRE